jgi:hypothetical protein
MTDGDASRRHVLGLIGAAAATAALGMVGAERVLRRDDAVALSARRPATPTGQTAPVGPPSTISSTTTSSTTTSSTTTSSTTTSTTEAPTTTEPPEPDGAYSTIAGEVEADAKQEAARVVEALTTYAPHEDPTSVVARALESTTAALTVDGVVEHFGPLLVAGVSSQGRVVYPQLGGLDPHHDPRRCSVMVVLDQHLDDGTGRRRVSRCLDVRLRRNHRGSWEVESFGDVSGAEVAEPEGLPEVALATLGHPAISVPDSVRWDIYEGVVDHRVLHELVLLADRAPIGVTSCRRGHPEHVFGTGRLSAHSVGRAIDVWFVDGPVVQQRDPSSTAFALTQDMFRAGRVGNLGSPWHFGGPARRSFTDPVHQDHLHLGFS